MTNFLGEKAKMDIEWFPKQQSETVFQKIKNYTNKKTYSKEKNNKSKNEGNVFHEYMLRF